MEKDIKDLEIVEDNSEVGATMVEYALMVALLAVALIAAVVLLQQNVSQTFSRVGSAVNTQ
ncbi:MAG: Flp family type IVb pilin [Bdellovibrionales bacterium]|nr:Flp family type IVb pilin [Bdellovibrionales bacterium]